jgi:hypothetical protein
MATTTDDTPIPGKGEMNGTCNRGACNNRRAIHFNRVTCAWYCTPCARAINENKTWDNIPLCDWPNDENTDENDWRRSK